MIEHPWQRVPDAGSRLQAVMEDDDIAGSDTLKHLVGTTLRIESGVEIATEQAPHHRPHRGIQRFDPGDLPRTDATVWRAEQSAADELRGLPNILKIAIRARPPTVEVAVCVVADGMPLLPYPLEEKGMGCDVGTDAEECPTGSMAGQEIQHLFRDAGAGSVVEGQVYGRGIR